MKVGLRGVLRHIALLAIAFMACHGGSARAGEVSVSATSPARGDLSIEIKDETLGEVLGVLSTRYGFKVERPAGGDAQPISGKFQGTLSQVLQQLLQRDDYVIVYRPDRAGDPRAIDTVHILGSRGQPASALLSAAPTSTSSAVSDLLTQSAFTAVPDRSADPDAAPVNSDGPSANRTGAGSIPGMSPIFTQAPASRPLPAVPGANRSPDLALASMTRAASANVQSLAQALQRVTEQMTSGH